MITNGELGVKLKLIREYKNISRKDFADKLNAKLKLRPTDVSYLDENKIQRIEKGKKNISATFLDACSKVLDVNVRLFFEDINEIISKDSSDILFNSKTELIMRMKLNKLVKIMDKITDDKVYNKFLSLLESFEKN